MKIQQRDQVEKYVCILQGKREVSPIFCNTICSIRYIPKIPENEKKQVLYDTKTTKDIKRYNTLDLTPFGK